MPTEASEKATIYDYDGGGISSYQELSNLLYFPLFGMAWTRFTDIAYWGSWLANGLQGSVARFEVKDTGSVSFWMHQNAGFSEVLVTVDDAYYGIFDMNALSENYYQMNVAVTDDGNLHVIKLGNLGTSESYGGFPLNWMSIMGLETTGMLSEPMEEMMSQFLVSATIMGAQTVAGSRSRKTMPFSVRFPVGTLTLAQIIAKHDATIQKLAAVTGGEILSSNVQIFPALPSGLNTDIEDGVRVQDGALFTFDLTGTPYVDSLFVPAIRTALLGTDGLSILTDDDAIQDLLSYLTTENGANADPNPAAVNRFDKVYASLQASGWVQRK